MPSIIFLLSVFKRLCEIVYKCELAPRSWDVGITWNYPHEKNRYEERKVMCKNRQPPGASLALHFPEWRTMIYDLFLFSGGWNAPTEESTKRNDCIDGSVSVSRLFKVPWTANEKLRFLRASKKRKIKRRRFFCFVQSCVEFHVLAMHLENKKQKNPEIETRYFFSNLIVSATEWNLRRRTDVTATSPRRRNSCDSSKFRIAIEWLSECVCVGLYMCIYIFFFSWKRKRQREVWK